MQTSASREPGSAGRGTGGGSSWANQWEIIGRARWQDVRMPAPSADGAILGATVHTLDDRRPSATAVAWRDGVLLAVGDDVDVRAHVGPGTDVIDGAGLTVVPGLVDTHIHPFYGTLQT